LPYHVKRYHDISCGHTVFGHESKCAHLHGHNYRVHFVCRAEELDGVGRVVDFGVVKSQLCEWLETNWDHKFLIWAVHPSYFTLKDLDPEGVVAVPFNPTAENMARFLVECIGPIALEGTGVELVECHIEETAKCAASFTK